MIRLLAESDDAKGQTVNVGNQEQELSIGELARLVIEVVGRDLDMTPGPQTPGSPSRRSPEMSRAIGLTGFSPRVGLREGVTRTFDWYKHTIFDGGVASAR
jgi:nucleoside-diphosphate-sugar epimerase